MKIDIHTHIMPEKMPNWTRKFGYGDFIHLEHRDCQACMMKGDKIFRVVKENLFNPRVRIIEMDRESVNTQVISTIPVLFNYWAKAEHGLETSQLLNDHIASTCQKNADRFIGLGTVPMQHVDFAIREMERCVKSLNLAGVEIGTNVNGRNLSEPEFIPFFESAASLGCSIFVHPWDMMGQSDMEKYWLPWLVGMPAETARAICSLIFSGIFERFPSLRIAFAHGGGAFPFTLGRIAHGFEVRPDLVAIDNSINPNQYIGRFWVDSLVHDMRSLLFLMDVMGENNICLGSDYPFPLGESRPGMLINQIRGGDEIKDKLLHKNALAWLGKAG